MSLAPGARLGPYEVLTLLGAGGMGEVYKARDMRLGRSVALKVLHTDIAQEPGLRERFEQEARAVSSLNHPRICTLYDVGQHDQREFLVMEFVEGETLADRLRRGPLPLDTAVRCAIEIAEGLDHAHRNGITHRDLKPANVILSRTGAKLLDFGLAKLREPAAEATSSLDRSLARLESAKQLGLSPSNLPTSHRALTRTGAILGTFEYMAPEQLEGHEANERTDIFSFGTTVYETVTGYKAFEARTPASLIGAVLMGEPPPMQDRRPGVPPLLDQIVRRCLAKDPNERWQSVRDLLLALQWVRDGVATTESRHRQTTRETRLAVAVALLAVIAAGLTVWRVVGPVQTSAPALRRWDVALPPGQSLAAAEFSPSLAVSPDGTRLVFRVQSGAVSQLYLQRLDQFEAQPIQGTEGAHSPFFSPDGKWIGFLAKSRIFRVAVTGGAALLVGNVPALSPGSPGVTWGPGGTIVFAAGASGLMQVPEAGGAPKQLTTPSSERGEVLHIYPQFLPGGEELLFTIRTDDDTWRVAVLSLRTLQWDWLPSIGEVAGASYVSTGHLVYAQAGNLFAIPLDVSKRAFTGSPVPLSEPVYTRLVTDALVAQFTVSDSGLLVCVSGDPPNWTLVSVRADGQARLMVDAPHFYRYPRFSPNGDRVAVTVEDDRNDIYIVDADRRTIRTLTRVGSNTQATWTPDSQRVTFSSRRRGSSAFDIYSMPIDEGAEAERLITRDGGQFPTSWSPQGDLLAFYELNEKSARDIWVWSVRDKSSRAVLASPANERAATFSPDGRLLAYVSDELGQDEVYIQRYPGPGGRDVVSSGGGTEPAWSPNGRELFYRNNDQLLAVTIRTEPRIAADTPRVLFTGPYVATPVGAGPRNYDVSPDGQSFVMVRRANSSEMHLHVIHNWFAQLRPQTAE